MKKKIFILLILLLLTGCKAQYNLQINFGGNVIETSNIYLNSNLVGRGGYSSDRKEFLDQVAENYKFYVLKKKLKFDEGGYLGYKTYQRYRNLELFADRSPAISNLYDGLSVTESDNLVVIKSVGSNKISEYHNLTGDIPSVVEKVEISISLPYKVVRNNANHVDADTNTYTWDFSADKFGEIDLEYLSNELFTTNPTYLFRFVSPYIYITAGLILIVLIVFLSVKNKFRLANKI